MNSYAIEVSCALPGCNEKFVKKSHNHLYHSKKCKRLAGRDPISTERSAFLIPEIEGGEETDLVDYLRKENRRLSSALAKQKLVKQDAVETIFDVAEQTFKQFKVPRVPSPQKDKRKGVEETAVAILADFQLGKETRTYNSKVCEERIDFYADEVVRITNVMRSDHPVKNIRVWALGDIVEGEDIYPGQTNEIDASLYTQVGVNGPKILVNFLNKMLANFETVHFVGVPGNHGTLTGGRKNSYNNETNMDRLLYKIVEWIFKDEPRITFDIPDGYGSTSFYAVDTIGDYSTLLMHGNQFASPTSTHSYYRKVMGWKDGAIPERFDDIAIGHWHHNVKMTIGSSTLRIVGSPESHNEFAQELLGAMSRPSQHLQFVNPRTGVTSEHTVMLDCY